MGHDTITRDTETYFRELRCEATEIYYILFHIFFALQIVNTVQNCAQILMQNCKMSNVIHYQEALFYTLELLKIIGAFSCMLQKYTFAKQKFHVTE